MIQDIKETRTMKSFDSLLTGAEKEPDYTILLLGKHAREGGPCKDWYMCVFAIGYIHGALSVRKYGLAVTLSAFRKTYGLMMKMKPLEYLGKKRLYGRGQ